jgi:hypothetical protein
VTVAVQVQVSKSCGLSFAVVVLSLVMIVQSVLNGDAVKLTIKMRVLTLGKLILQGLIYPSKFPFI